MVGIFAVDIQIARPGNRPSFMDVRGVMVDTGAEVTWISAEALRRARVRVRWGDQPFVKANGAQVTRDVGYAIIRCGEFETIDEVVFARRGDLQLLGARTLEGFNAKVDTRHKRLVASGPIPAAPNWTNGQRPGTKHPYPWAISRGTVTVRMVPKVATRATST